MINVILLQRVGKLGHIGDVVSVKPGYARNFLLPRGKALRSTPENLAIFEKQKADLLAKNLEHKKDAESLAKEMKDLSVIAVRQAGETGHLYGSVNTRDVAELVKEKGFNIDRQSIRIDTPIKTIGLHPVHVTLHAEVEFNIIVNVAKSEDEAIVQAEEAAKEAKGEKKAKKADKEAKAEEAVAENTEETAPVAEAKTEEAAAPAEA